MAENSTQTDAVQKEELSYNWFMEDQTQDRVKFYTGLPNFETLVAIFELISPGLPNRKYLSKFQERLTIPIFLVF